MSRGESLLVNGEGRTNSVNWPFGVSRPIRFVLDSVNQKLPSGARTMPTGVVLLVGMVNSWKIGDGSQRSSSRSTAGRAGRGGTRDGRMVRLLGPSAGGRAGA